ncbi:hypothetical protein [Sphingopyxis sp. GW247-27LB]|uniref:hypothetical protein n=1 Tax=Sphingopyxis sp. GW247-27LB TaxID=2012632 RepID=UPI000BA63C2C|nr:hypothetical protein [Sphingopyxis sp. GW247-27LB]PAL22408.1 hypothetical protein CD928_09910 [Sphingopyxis sp. GW247-27LB]
MKRHHILFSLLLAGGAGVALAGCGQSDFAKMVEAECAQDGDPGKDCSCIASQLDDGLPDRVKVAFPALRWPMKPAPQDREAVNNQLLRAAGVDPADRQAVESIRQEYEDSYYPLRNAVRAACGGSV